MPVPAPIMPPLMPPLIPAPAPAPPPLAFLHRALALTNAHARAPLVRRTASHCGTKSLKKLYLAPAAAASSLQKSYERKVDLVA